MSSQFLRSSAALLATAGMSLTLAACGEEKQPTAAGTPGAQTVPQDAAVTGLFPGDGKPPPPDPAGKKYVDDSKAIADGRRLFLSYNCAGCHFHGGGGIGPALMDKTWIYGGEIDQIFMSIYRGRPNGMPAWRGKLPDEQLWQIAAYVHQLPQEADKMDMPTAPPPAVPEPSTERPGAAPVVKTNP